jgi:hypothetical protein
MKSDHLHLGRAAGSPPVVVGGGAFRGVALDTPQANVFVGRSARPAIWIHGGLRLDGGQLGRGDAYLDLVSLILVDETALGCRTARLLPNFLPSPDPFDPAALSFRGRVVSQYFSVDLGGFFGLPAADADYVVRAALGPLVSNALRVRLRVDA